jgi:hypothetical protein
MAYGWRYCTNCKELFKHTNHSICPRCDNPISLLTQAAIRSEYERLGRADADLRDWGRYYELEGVLAKINEGRGCKP